MKSRTAAALLSGLGVVTGGAVWAVPGLAGAAPAAAVVDSTVPDDDAPDTSTAEDAAADESASADTSTDEPETDDSDDSTAAESDATDTESATENPDRASRIAEALQPLVDDGTLTEEQLAAVIDALGDVRISESGHRSRITLLDVDTLTETLGLSAEELRAALNEGQTIAEIAEAEGVAIDDLVAALVAAATERIDEAVANGRLTEDDAATLTDDLTERITERLESTDGIGGPSWSEDGRGQGRQGRQDGPFGQNGPQSQNGQMPQLPQVPQSGPQGPGGQVGPGGNGGPGMPGDAPTFNDGSNSQSDAPAGVDSADATTT